MSKENWDNQDIIWDVARRVALLCHGTVRWTARQHVGKTFAEGDADLYGFAIDSFGSETWGDRGGFAAVTIGQAKNADDALLTELAAEVMGYAPDSEPDLARLAQEAKYQLERIGRGFLALEKERVYWDAMLARATHKLINPPIVQAE